MRRTGFVNVVVIVIAIAIAFGVGVAGYVVLQENSAPTGNKPSEYDISSIFQKADGCGNIYVYQTNKDGDVGISVNADTTALNLSAAAKTFNIASADLDDLRVELLLGENVGFLYCNDAMDPNQPEYKTLLGKTGEVTISTAAVDESQQGRNRDYTAAVVLRDVHFAEEDGSDSDVVVSELIFEDIRVGWLPG